MANLGHPVLKNVETGEIIEISKSPFTIGRRVASHYVIKDSIISRNHCVLVKTGEGWVLQNLSLNGTTVNEETCEGTLGCLLKNSDVICLGFHEYTYEFLMRSNIASNPEILILQDNLNQLVIM